MGLLEFQDIKDGLPQTITGHSRPSACNVCETMMWLRTDDGCQTGSAARAGSGGRAGGQTPHKNSITTNGFNTNRKRTQ